MEALPSDIRVLGINDYWFLDGYRKVRAAKQEGRLSNIDEIFPVVEVRCDTFSGSEGALKRLNLHLILDPSQPVDDLEGQIKSILRAQYRLTPDDALAEWNEVPTRASMERLGRRIVESTPEEKRAEFANKTDLEIGFNNLNVSFDGVVQGVQGNTYLREHVILALGKIEWENIKWNAASIAHKKTLVNSVHAVFTAAKTRESFDKSLASLKAAKVRHTLLDCSDAHTWSDSDSPNRLGQCFIWVNADPTFKGLRQALQEYDQRITVTERPVVLTRLAQSPRSVITDVTLRPIDSGPSNPLFSSTTPLNPGFVVVIGNKGQGKSALLDSIALAANSDRQEDFSFLNGQRFRAMASTASQYEVEVKWVDSSNNVVGLNDPFSHGSPIRVDYLPQSLIEKVWSADPNSQTRQEFEAEIERVVFRHIDDETRGAVTNLKQLLQSQGVEQQTTLQKERAKIVAAAEALSALNRRRAELEALDLPAREKSLTERLTEIESKLQSIRVEIDSGGTAESQTQAAELHSAQDSSQVATDAIDSMRQRQEAITSKIDEANSLRKRLRALINDAQAVAEDLAQKVGLAPDSLLKYSFEEPAVDAWISESLREQAGIEQSRTESGGLDNQLVVASRHLKEQQELLLSLNEETLAMMTHQSDLRAQAEGLRGTPAERESLRGIEALLLELREIPAAIAAEELGLRSSSHEVHKALSSIKDLQRAAYEPATHFVESNDLAKSVQLAFDVEFRVREFADSWSSMVNRQRLGQFHDMSRQDRDEQIMRGVDLDDAESLLAALDTMVDQLGREGGKIDGDTRSLDIIMRSGHSAADLLSTIYSLDWLNSQYVIRASGKELSELSPGQRGLVLLLFYLLVDKSERPLLLDQPEENLDNQTVRNVLVPALQEAVRRRQVIAVTHNPNFAVVGDADQIIVAAFEGSFGYRAGSLAELNIGQSAIDVLEGTRAAFLSRNVKYTDVVGKDVV
ncbi:AAA family ATPase [Rhodococcus sp. KBS0724]|nr:AAA family ATPase [Rhodococcus sp. KBS0724]TSD40510.1 AAA family ATPase [Rhodococcus sp. KBS0724]